MDTLLKNITTININYLNTYNNQYAGNSQYLSVGANNNVMTLLNGYNGSDYQTGQNTDAFFKLKTLNAANMFSNDGQSYSNFVSTGGLCPLIKVNGSYVQSTLNNLYNDSTLNLFDDISLIQFLSPNAKTTDNKPSIDLYNGLYAVYNILDSSNLMLLLNGGAITVNLPNNPTAFNIVFSKNILTITNDTNNYLLGCINMIINMNDILKSTNFNLFIFKEFIRLYIYSFNLGIASNIFRTSYDQNVINSIVFNSNLFNFDYLIVSYIILLEQMIYIPDFNIKNDATPSKINNQLSQINATFKNFKHLKHKIKTNQDYYSTTTTNKSTVSKYEYLSIAFLILIVILSIILETTESSNTKLVFILSTTIVIIATVSYIVINYLYGKSILEKFASGAGIPTADSGSPTADSGSLTADSGSPTADSGSPTADSGSLTAHSGSLTADSGSLTAHSGSPTYQFSQISITGTDVNNVANVNINVDYFNSLYNQESNEWLNRIIMFIDYVDQENANGNLSTMLTNQQLYYNDMMNKMDMQNNKLSSTAAIVNNQRYNADYRMNLYANLTLIIAISVILRAAISSYNTTVPFYIGILGIILAVISIIIYLIETRQRVRTDPTRLYWYEGKNQKLKNNSN